MATLSDYDLYNQLGQGTFGVVTKARQKSSKKLVAIKKFIVSDKKEGFPITAFREITIMKKLENLNVLQIIDMIYDSSHFYTVFPYISSDLNGLLNNPRVDLNLPQIKCIMLQLLNGINYIHQNGYLHRDIKTANILLDHFGIIKIADFGLARLYHGEAPKLEDSPPGGGKYEYTGLVVTRWYRPPELLLGDKKYTTAVDIWGIGCVFGELFTKRPILEGKSDIHQAEIIFKLLGSPNSANFPNAHLINRNGIDLKINYSRSLEFQFSKLMSNDAIDLLSGMLTLNPMERFNAVKCLNSNFFKTNPLPCASVELSNLEESHESDVKRFKDELKITINNTNNNASLNHSKYGIETSNYMNRADSTLNMPPSQQQHPQQQSYNDHRYHQSRFATGAAFKFNEYDYERDYEHDYDYDKVTDDYNYYEGKGYVQQHNNNTRHMERDTYYPPGRSKRSYNNSHGFDRYPENDPKDGDYYYDRGNGNKRQRQRTYQTHQSISSQPPKENLFSSQARGKDLYGSSSNSDNIGLSALTRVLKKKKQNEHVNTNTTTNRDESNIEQKDEK